MSIRRDPQTGQFMSTSEGVGGVGGWHETTQYLGAVHLGIPAADQSGGEEISNHGNDSSLEIFQGDFLDNDEVFEVVTLSLNAYLNLHTTYSAESYAEWGWEISPNETGTIANENSPFFAGSPTDVQDGIDAVKNTQRRDSILWTEIMTTENSVADGTNTLGLGGDQDRLRRFIPFRSLYGQGPIYDRDDELSLVGEFRVDGASDGALAAGVFAGFRGVIHQLD